MSLSTDTHMLLAPSQPRPGTPLLSRPHQAAPLPAALLAAFNEPLILFPAAEYQLARELLAAPVPALAVECDPLEGVLVHLDGQRVRLPACPPLCLAAIAFTEEGEAAMQEALDTMPGADAAPAIARLAPGDPMALASAVMGGSGRLLRRQAGQLATTLRSLTELRAAHAEREERLVALEAFVSRGNRQDFDCVFAEAPAEDGELALRLGEDANLRAVAQTLPVASRGVSAVALHLAETPLTPDAVVTARLESLEDGIERATWRVPASALSPGWQVFGLDAAITGLSRTLRLSVEVSEGTIALSLGAEQPLPAFRVQGEGGAVTARNLAFKVFAGLPGVMPPLPEIDHLEGEAGLPGGFEQIPVTAESIELTQGRETRTLRALPDETLPCDAPAEGIAIGRLRAGLPRGALLLGATGFGRDVEFALATGEHLPAIRAQAEAGVPAGPGWSGWIAAEASGETALRLFCEPDRRAPRDLFILTRAAGATRARIGALSATVPLEDAFAQPAAPAAEPIEIEAGPRAIPATEFRGTGFHGLEGAGERRWRWLGRQLALKLEDVARGAEAIEMDIVATAPGLSSASIAALVNGMPAAVELHGTLSAGLVARIALPREARRGDRSLALHLTFARCHQPPGDGRTLSVATTGIRVVND